MDNESNDKKIAIFYLKWAICIADKTNLTTKSGHHVYKGDTH